MTEDSSAQLDLARRLLAHEAGGSSDPHRLAGAADGVCQKLRQQLAPILGEAGFRSIMVRAQTLTRGQFPTLAVDPAPDQGACLRGLREWVQGQDPARAGEAIVLLLASFLAVLIGLIGEDLARTFLHVIWPDVPIP